MRIKREESREEMRRRIEQAIEETERGENLISFTGEECETRVKNLSKNEKCAISRARLSRICVMGRKRF